MSDLERIAKHLDEQIEEMANPDIWLRYTVNMEMGELKEFKQYWKDQETILAALKAQIAANDRLPEAADARPLTADDLCAMVKQNGGKPVVVFVYCIDKDGSLVLDYGEWEMFDGRDFVCAGIEDDLRGYGERFVAYKEPLTAPHEGYVEAADCVADACPLTGCGCGEADAV